ncbi:MAG TPA: hypothetical protein VF995_08180 [Actinomycetota bacterium]
MGEQAIEQLARRTARLEDEFTNIHEALASIRSVQEDHSAQLADHGVRLGRLEGGLDEVRGGVRTALEILERIERRTGGQANGGQTQAQN